MKPYFILLVTITLCSCSDYETGTLEHALKSAGSNKNQLETVLNYYKQNQADSMKLKAVEFLIKNMMGKEYIDGPGIEEYYTFIDSVYQIQLPEYDIEMYHREFHGSAKKDRAIKPYKDLKKITSGYLINHIDQAFSLWKYEWNRHLTFDEFCEYLLPYRIEDELPENWIPMYQARFEGVLNDSIQTALDACTAINNQLIAYPIHIATSSIRYSAIRPSSLIHIKFGLCQDWANLAVYAMRACGVPVGIEEIPHFGHSNSSHTFNFVYDNDGQSYDFSGGENNPREHLSRFKGIPKVYRKTYGIQKSSLASICGKEKIPEFFRDPCLIDVTSNYDFIEQQDIVLDIPQGQLRNRFVYLCVFDPKGWEPVDWCEAVGNQAKFDHVGTGIVYSLAYFKRNKMICMNVPFMLDSVGKIIKLLPSTEQVNLVLDRKYPQRGLLNVPVTMKGGLFQASNDSNFIHAIDIYRLDQSPTFKYTTIQTTTDGKYRYSRYIAPELSRVNMAEIEFMDSNGQPVAGRAIGTNTFSIYSSGGKEKVFDGDALTFFLSEEPGGWIGMEFNEPVQVTQIRYLIRNDDNGIRKGNDYELFYATADGWKSAGRQRATIDDQIEFRNVPADALYWLRNYMRGKEERIFVMVDGKQVFY